jgi:flagellar L-ring protein FlgH
MHDMMPNLVRRSVNGFAALGAVAVLLSGCTSGGLVKMHEPITARPAPREVPPAPTNGAIFQGANFHSAGFYRPLFEDRKAHTIGDMLVVQISEKLSASQQSKSSADRGASTGISIPLIKGIPGKTLQGMGITGSGDNKFEGKGETSNNNVFTGTISVTVVDVLPNGNLLVAGDKQIGINHNAETLRFSGIVSPATIQAGNSVNSSQVAEARLEYVGKGYIDEAQSMPWLQRIFINLLPF